MAQSVRVRRFGYPLLLASLLGSACGDDSGSGAEATEDTATGPLELDALSFERYESQPMVVDARFNSSRALDFGASDLATWAHAEDPGISVAWLSSSDDGLEHTFRVRGLAPESTHALSLSVESQDETAQLEDSVETLAALPGFVGSFDVAGTTDNPEIMRLFDLSTQGGGNSGIVLMDPQGQTRWYWGREFAEGVHSVIEGVKLREDGSVLFTVLDRLTIRDELAQIQWQVVAEDYGLPSFHHEALELPNGNFLTLGREFALETYDEYGTLSIAGDTILEFTPDKELVWVWSSLEHLDPQRIREGFDPLLPSIFDPETGEVAGDWTHANGLEYDAESDTLLLSLRHQDWVLAIDHQSGEVLWKLGDEGDFTLESGSWFFHQHSPQWLPDGSLLLYDNANDNPYTPIEQWAARAVIYDLDFDAMTATQVWEDDMPDFFSPAMGDVDLMPNGNFLVTDSFLGIETGSEGLYSRIREIDRNQSPETQWTFETPINRIAYRGVAVDRWVGERSAAP